MEHLFRKIIIRQRFSDNHMSINARVEAILYASEEPISASDISVIINEPKDEVIKAIREINRNYRKYGSALEIRRSGIRYKIQLNPEYSSIVAPVSKKEIGPIELKVLGYVAANPGCIKGDVIRKFGEKSRGPISNVIERKFVSSRKFRNTELLTPTREFYRYFNISPKGLQSKSNLAKSTGEQDE
jgi:chromosome segregation and condensation protein ScpB